MTSEKLRWAAIQLLQQYQRCGVNQVVRGTERFAIEWTDAPAQPSVGAISELPAAASTDSPPMPAMANKSDSATADTAVPPRPPMPMVPLRGAAKDSRASMPSRSSPTAGILGVSEATWLGPAMSNADRQDVLATLRAQVASCRKCDELACSRKQIVFGVGNLSPRVVFFGEAPGAEEDRLGEPFVGAAGQLLNKIISASQMQRDEVYILNSLKCRPPGNRTPFDSEIENCRPFFEAQLEALQPEFIVCLGAVAVRAVLRTADSVGRLRGKFHRYRQAQVLVTYHPAYLLRNESAKKYVWEDMKMLMQAMGLKSPNV